MATVGNLVVKLEADIARLQSDMDKMNRQMAGFGNTVDKVKHALAGLVTVGAALGAGRFLKGLVDQADELNKLSIKSGIAHKELSGLRYAAELADIEFNELSKGLKEFNKSLSETNDKSSTAAKIFSALGVDPKGGQYETFIQTLEAVSKIQDHALKVRTAVELWGKAGEGFLVLADKGAAGIRQAADEAKRAGMIMDKEMAEAAEKFNDDVKAIGRSFDGLVITITGPLMSALGEMLGKIKEAVLEGRGLSGVFKEMLKMSVATMGAVGGKLPIIGPLFEDAAQAGFNALSSTGGAMGGPASGKIRRPVPLAEQRINESALRGAFSGNGAEAAAKKEQDRINKLGQQIIKAQEALEEQRAETRRAFWENVEKPMLQEQAADELAIEQGIIDDIKAMEEEYYERGRQRLEIIKQQQKEQEEAMKSTKEVARDLGMTFASAFEEAVVQGKKLSEVLKGLLQDIIKIMARKLVTEPMAELLSGVLGSAKKFMGFASGGSFEVAGSGGTDSQLVAFRATPGEQVSVAPPHRTGGGGGNMINVTVNVEASDQQQGNPQEMGRMVASAVRSVLLDEMRPGGMLA